MRKVPIVTGHIYHIFNRGVNKNNIFFAPEDYQRFIETAVYYKSKKEEKVKFSRRYTSFLSDPGSDSSSDSSDKVEGYGVQVLGYCLMPNHFHLLIKQLVDGALSSYLQHLANSYSHYVNVKYKRIGPLFQGPFKNVLLESDDQLVHLSRYIHLNPLVSNMTHDLSSYKWSSYLSFIGKHDDGLVDPAIVLGYFHSRGEYEQFVFNQADYGKELEKIKHIVLDLP